MRVLIEKLDGTKCTHDHIDNVVNRDEHTVVLYREKLVAAIETKGDMKSFKIIDPEPTRRTPPSQG